MLANRDSLVRRLARALLPLPLRRRLFFLVSKNSIHSNSDLRPKDGTQEAQMEHQLLLDQVAGLLLVLDRRLWDLDARLARLELATSTAMSAPPTTSVAPDVEQCAQMTEGDNTPLPDKH
jgi:hypothetical protein